VAAMIEAVLALLEATADAWRCAEARGRANKSEAVMEQAVTSMISCRRICFDISNLSLL
jgi:hypothetical protein